MDEYVIMNKTDLVSMADTIRDTLGSTDSIAVTDLGAKLIESIEAGVAVEILTLEDTLVSQRQQVELIL